MPGNRKRSLMRLTSRFNFRTLLLLILSTTSTQWALAEETLPSDHEVTAVSDSLVTEVDYFKRDTYRIDPYICPFKGDVDYKPGEIECGLLQVPENREKPDSRMIELSFIKLNSLWDEEKEAEKDEEDRSKLPPGKRDDPIIYLTGGPGAQALGYVKRFKDHGIRTHRDLYILEQRGIGHSGDFCLKYGLRQPALNNATTMAEHLATTITMQNNCSQNASAAGVDLTGYNTIENARDVRALRHALGFEQWNVWGISYGTILGQAYINEDPQGIRAIVLDSISPLNARDNIETWQILTWYDRDLQKLDALCQADDDCAANYPDLGKKVREAILSVKDNPITVKVKETEIYPSGEAHIFADAAGFLPFGLFYEQSNYAALPAVIYAWSNAIIERDETLFKALMQADGGADFSISQGMYDTVICNDGEMEAFANSLRKELTDHPVLASAVVSEESLEAARQRCASMGMAPRDESQYRLPQTDIPALLVEGDMDPITPEPLGKIIFPGFKNGTYVEFPFAGHGPTRSVKCAGEMLNKFYDNPTDKPDLSCTEEMEKPQLLGSIFHTNIVPRMLLKAVEDKKSLIGPGVWGGLSAFIIVIAFIFLSFAAIGRKIDGRQAVAVGSARWYAWLAATSGFLALAITGAAFAMSIDSSEILVVFGLASFAKYGAVLSLLCGALGLVTLMKTIQARQNASLPIGTLLGFILTGLASSSLCAFFIYWDLSPF